jgi:hypothetical protein
MEARTDLGGCCLLPHRGPGAFQQLSSLDAEVGEGVYLGVTASSPKSSSTVNTANYQLIKHISWVYYF